MRKSRMFIALFLTAAIVIGASACSTTTADTPAETTLNTKNELDEVDWGVVAAEDIDEENEAGTGELYESGKTAGVIHSLCYYDIGASEANLAQLYAERFGGTIETEVVSSALYLDKFSTLVAAGDSPDMVRYDWEAFPWGVSKNLYLALDDWLDIDSEMWADEREVIENFAYAGKHYYFPATVIPNFAIIYDRVTLEEAGLDDPIDLYNDGDWTWDSFERLIREWANISEDNVGFTGGSWSAMMFANTTGTAIVDITDTDIICNLENINVQRTMDWLSGLKKEGYIGNGYVHPMEAFSDGTLLFLGMGLTWGFESAEERLYDQGIDGEICALPFPRDPQADKYYVAADTLGYMVPSGAENIQGAIQWILASRLYETDEEVLAADYAEKTDTSPAYYAKCADCKYNFVENGTNDLDTCPECGAARKQKFKPYYSEEQMEIIADMTDSSKFSFIFDNSVGFGTDVASVFTGGEETVFDGPIFYGTSFTQLRTQFGNTVEAYIQPYRDALTEAIAENQ